MKLGRQQRVKGIFSLLNTSKVIGLDLGLEKLNLVQFETHSGRPIIQAAASEFHNSSYDELLDKPDSLKALIKSTFNRYAFKGRKVIASMPSSKLSILFLNYQCAHHQNRDEAVLNALRNRLKKNLEEFVIDYTTVKTELSNRVEQMALVAYVRKQDVENYLDLLRACGLSVEALEIGPIAIRRLIHSMNDDEQSPKVLTINFGTKQSFLTVLWDNDILLDRKVDFGLDLIIKSVTQSFNVEAGMALEMLHLYGLSDACASSSDDRYADEDFEIRKTIADILNPIFAGLASEIRDVLVYIASETRGGSVEQIYLLGSLARLSGIDQVLDNLISIPVKTINPFIYFSREHETNKFDDLGPVSGVAVAAGLALRAD